MVETFFDLDDLETAVAAIRAVSALPIVALMTFDADGRDARRRVRGEAAGERLHELDVAAFGANHGAGPAAALTALAEMSGDGRVLAALPNVGLASLSGQRIVFPHATPSTSASSPRRRVSSAPASSAAAAARRRRRSPRSASAVDGGLAPAAELRGSLLVRMREEATRPAEESTPTGLARLLDEGTFVVSVQLNPPLGANPEASSRPRAPCATRARRVRRRERQPTRPRAHERDHGVGRDRAVHVGIETIPHLTPRDMTVIGLESILLGAHAEGVRNILAITGDPPEVGDYPGWTACTRSTRSASSSCSHG